MNFFFKNMIFDSIPFEVHFTEVDSITGEKLIIFKSDLHNGTLPFNMQEKRSEWRSVNAPGVTTLFFKNEEHFSEQ